MKKITRFSLFTVLGVFGMAVVVFWAAFGYPLSFDVYQGGNGESSYWYTDSTFSFFEEAVISFVFGAVCGLAAFTVISLARLTFKIVKAVLRRGEKKV